MHVKHCIHFFFGTGGVQVVKEGGKKVCGTKEAVERLRLTPPHLEHTTGGESPESLPCPASPIITSTYQYRL